jgi:ribose 5-phosphate isomerase RpiB
VHGVLIGGNGTGDTIVAGKVDDIRIALNVEVAVS